MPSQSIWKIDSNLNRNPIIMDTSKLDIPLANIDKNGLSTYENHSWRQKFFEIDMKDDRKGRISSKQKKAFKKVKKMMKAEFTALNQQNFQPVETFLSHAEEFAEEKEFERIQFPKATLQKVGTYVSVRIPRLCESGLSIVPGTKLIFTLFGTEFKCKIEKVDENDVLYIRNEKEKGLLIKSGRKENCQNVRFLPNNICYERMRCSLRLMGEDAIKKFFTITPCHEVMHKEIDWYLNVDFSNELIGINQEQCQAVKHILHGTSSPHPYILFGPPGTGKTQTLIEAIFQVWKLIPGSRIVVTAPSNTATDLLALKLKDLIPEGSIVRLMSAAKEPHPELKTMVRYCDVGFEPDDPRGGQTILPSALSCFEIVVVTLGLSAILVKKKIEKFSHLFIDEAGQAKIAETVIPIPALSKNHHITLAGDPFQLGPVVKSRIASEFGMETSWLEHLMKSCTLYQTSKKRERNPNFITKLLKNFRSHPKMIKLPSKLFYDNELIPAASPNEVSKISKLPFIPNKGFPILFYGVRHPHKKSQGNISKSLFNPEEIKYVLMYIEILKKNSVPTSSIGVLSPYKLQVTKIKRELEKSNIRDVLVGSTEQFQGAERNVMIISTVRSIIVSKSPGFLTDRKRFNVAITRAKSLMIVIGDPYLLSTNPFKETWKHLVQYAVDNKSYVGQSIKNCRNIQFIL